MITPDSPDRQYSTRLRTALVLTGVGTAGAYHAGVLRALHEAGVRIDLVAGRGIGALGALFAAIDGGARLWEPGGLWQQAGDRAGAIAWRRPLRVAAWALVARLRAARDAAGPARAVASSPGLIGLLLLVGEPHGRRDGRSARPTRAGSTPCSSRRRCRRSFRGSSCCACSWRSCALGGALALAVLARAGPPAHRAGTALAAARIAAVARLRCSICAAEQLWSLIRGAAPIAAPARDELGRQLPRAAAREPRPAGIPRAAGDRARHGRAARRRVRAARRPASRTGSSGARWSTAPAAREAFDLAGVGRDHVIDALAASLTLPVATDPHLVRLPAEGPWRGETHRMCDRPGVARAAARGGARRRRRAGDRGVGRAAGRRAARAQLRPRRSARPRRRTARRVRGRRPARRARAVRRPLRRALRDPAVAQSARPARLRRRLRRALRPPRTRSPELVDRGYEDAYRQFIEPVVAASGEQIAQSNPSHG